MPDFSDTSRTAIDEDPSGFGAIEDTVSDRVPDEASGLVTGPIFDPDTCAWCGGSLAETRYVHFDVTIEGFCSMRCLQAALRERRRLLWAARRRAAKRFAIGAVFVGGFIAAHQGPPGSVRPTAAPARSAVDAVPLQWPSGWYGPVWPPTETSLLAALGRDAWVHPLSGPVRRMPRSDSRVFGAVRPGNRAIECRNGHCGVDLGGEIWGEHIHAVHDGVVDFVQRGANPEHGGSFVRISHHEGTIFTMYFHLAAIPRGLERGVKVKGGDVVGLVGDTGVKQSAPHLHFSLSIRAWKDGPEKYVDPEPMIALWPMRIPIDGSEVALVSTLGPVGVPLGSAPGRGKSKSGAGKQKGDAGDESAKPTKRGGAAPSGDDDEAGEGESPEPATTREGPEAPDTPNDE